MPSRVLSEWTCDGCAESLTNVNGEGLPSGWVALDIHTRGARNSLILGPKCLSTRDRSRILAAVLDPILEGREGDEA